MSHIRNNKLRVFYTIVSILIVCVAYKYNDAIVKNSDNFNEFGYIGGVATLIALMITIFEVVHNISISKSIQDEARKIIEHTKKIEGASFISECLSTLDEANDHLSGERYLISLKCFQHFRRTYVRISCFDATKSSITDILGDVELALHQATHTNSQAPLPKNKRKQIQEKIMSIKFTLENISPANGGVHVS